MCKAWEDQKKEERLELISRMLNKSKTPKEIAYLCEINITEVEEAKIGQQNNGGIK